MSKSWPRIMIAVLLAGALALPAYPASDMLREFEDAFIRIADGLRPCVVNIDAKTPSSDSGDDMQSLEELFRFFNAPIPRERMPRSSPRISSGSGFIYDKTGHIVTNNHVVENAESIEVRLWNGKKHAATVVGRDPQTDIAVIKINAGEDLPTAAFGDSDLIKVGQFAIAAGSPRGLEGSFSFGHVTALGRDLRSLPGLRFQNFIQTDAAINLGNSGGPLCNIDGEVIGINTAIVFGAEALGFAIPINMAKKIIPQLIDGGRVVRGYLGVTIKSAEEFSDALNMPDGKGAFVDVVNPDTPAERAGLLPDDVIRMVNGQAVENDRDLVGKISDIPPGSSVTLEVWRDGAPITLTAQLDEFPSSGETVAAAPPKDILGLRVRPLTEELLEGMGLEADTQGVVVESVGFDSPAENAGIRPGDIVMRIGKDPVTGIESFRTLMKENAKPGESILLRVLRGGESPTALVLRVPDDYKDE